MRNDNNDVYEFYYELNSRCPLQAFRLSVVRKTAKMYYCSTRYLRYRGEVRDVPCGGSSVNKDKIGAVILRKDGSFEVRVWSDSYEDAELKAIELLRDYFDGWIGSLYDKIQEDINAALLERSGE